MGWVVWQVSDLFMWTFDPNSPTVTLSLPADCNYGTETYCNQYPLVVTVTVNEHVLEAGVALTDVEAYGTAVINTGPLAGTGGASYAIAVGTHTTLTGESAFYIDNVERAALVLPVEATHTFNIHSATFAASGGHHLHFSATADGRISEYVFDTEYTTGVTNAGATTGQVRTPPAARRTPPTAAQIHRWFAK